MNDVIVQVLFIPMIVLFSFCFVCFIQLLVVYSYLQPYDLFYYFLFALSIIVWSLFYRFGNFTEVNMLFWVISGGLIILFLSIYTVYTYRRLKRLAHDGRSG